MLGAPPSRINPNLYVPGTSISSGRGAAKKWRYGSINIQEQGPFSVDSKKLESGPGAIYADFPSSPGVRVRGQSYSNFLASAAVADVSKA